MPIYCTPQSELRTKKSIIIAINNGATDLGVWSYRSLYREGGLEGGSCISLLKALHSGTEFRVPSHSDSDLNGKGEEEEPGLIILNPGQLLYSHRRSAALTHTSWLDQPRPSAVHPAPLIHPVHNLIPGNTSAATHVAYVFDNIVCNPSYVSPTARLYIIALVDGCRWLLEYLDSKPVAESPSPPLLKQIAALALIQPTHSPSELSSPALKALLRDRSKAYIVSPYPRAALLAAPWGEQTPNEWGHTPEIDVPTYASGERHVAELIFTGGDMASAGPGGEEAREVGRMRREILGWFGDVARADLDAAGEVRGPAILWGVLESECDGDVGLGYVNPRDDAADLEALDAEMEAEMKAEAEAAEGAYVGDGGDDGKTESEGRITEASREDRSSEVSIEQIGGPVSQNEIVFEDKEAAEGDGSVRMRGETPNEFADFQPDDEREKMQVAGWDMDMDLLEKARLI